MTQGSTPPGWYDDGQGAQRWWDGQRWTDQVQPAAPPAAPPTPPVAAQPPPSSTGHPQQYPQQYPPQHAPQYAPQFPQQPPSGGGMGKGLLWSLVGGGVVLVGALVVVLVLVLGGDDDGGDQADDGDRSSQSGDEGDGGGGGGGGGGEGGPDPAEVATSYLEAGSSGDFETVCELAVAEDVQEDFERYDVTDCAALGDAYDEQLGDAYLPYLEDITADVTIGEVTEDGDTASVDYTLYTKYEGDDPDGFRDLGASSLDETATGTLELEDEDGEWKVVTPSGSSDGSGGSGAEDAPAAEPTAVTPS